MLECVYRHDHVCMLKNATVVIRPLITQGVALVIRPVCVETKLELEFIGYGEPAPTEPHPITTDTRPHSRACGIHRHPHGNECSENCPTCHGRKEASN
jgi:hypothetical protein